jgi:hypothetical protein
VIFFKREVYRRALKELAPKLYRDNGRGQSYPTLS